MITNSLYVPSVVKLVIHESTALRLNAVFASKRVICRTYVIELTSTEENNKQEANEVPAEDMSASLNEIVAEADPKTNERPVDLSTTNVKTSMDFQEDQGRKRSCPIESDSDTKIPIRRSRYHPAPNIENAKQRGKSTDKKLLAS